MKDRTSALRALAALLESLPDEVTITVRSGQTCARLIVPPATPGDALGLTQLQEDILRALKGCALRTDALAAAVDVDRSSLFRRRKGATEGPLPELVSRGLVAHDDATGYYRPDAPPPGTSPGSAAELPAGQGPRRLA